MNVLKVSAKTDIKKLARAISIHVTQNGSIEIQSVGKEAALIAVSGVVYARGYFKRDGNDLICTPGFKRMKSNEKKQMKVATFVVSKA